MKNKLTKEEKNLLLAALLMLTIGQMKPDRLEKLIREKIKADRVNHLLNVLVRYISMQGFL